MASLFSKYRPRSWDDLIGHAHIKRAIQMKATKGELGGSAYMFTGPSGCGKTSIAYLLAGEMCEPDNFIELDAGDVTPARLEDLERRLACRCLKEREDGPNGRAVLVNEAHGLRQDTIRKLLVVLEEMPLLPQRLWAVRTSWHGSEQRQHKLDNRRLTLLVSFTPHPDSSFLEVSLYRIKLGTR